jgi:hypothetical protein
MKSEITVTIKGEDSSYKKKFLCHDEIRWTQDDPTLKGYIEEAISDFKGTPDTIRVRGLIEVV